MLRTVSLCCVYKTPELDDIDRSFTGWDVLNPESWLYRNSCCRLHHNGLFAHFQHRDAGTHCQMLLENLLLYKEPHCDLGMRTSGSCRALDMAAVSG